MAGRSSRGAPQAEPLLCPSCARSYPPDARFCEACRMPLVHSPEVSADQALTDRQERLRKIKPQLAEGKLVRVAGARNQAEAEFIQGLLLEEGVPSLLRRTAGFDVPDFLAAGPRDVLVPESGAGTAREVLLQAEIISATAQRPVVAPLRLLAGLMVALAVGVLLVWLVTLALR